MTSSGACAGGGPIRGWGIRRSSFSCGARGDFQLDLQGLSETRSLRNGGFPAPFWKTLISFFFGFQEDTAICWSSLFLSPR